MRLLTILSASLALALAACGPSLPKDAVSTDRPARVLPDNDGATLPPNIAPLNFEILDRADGYLTHLHADGTDADILVEGRTVDIDVERWHRLLAAARGRQVLVDIYLRHGERWTRCPSVRYDIAPDTCDAYVTYRLIPPSYVAYERLTINERNVTNFDERVLYDNMMLSDGSAGQCVNCHIPRQWNRTGESQFHVRQTLGGTVMIRGDKAVKVDLKTDSTLSAGVYAAWHPTLPLVAYSVNATGQSFHTLSRQKVEVIDYGSDLILYDDSAHTVRHIDHAKDDYETFPCWSADGKTLFYCAAHHPQTTDNIDNELDSAYQSLRYSIFARPFDPRTRTFGPRRTVLDADSTGLSAAFPRVSPDGRWLLFSAAPYGQFHIWHERADLYVADLRTGRVAPLTEANSRRSDSYHTWSSNGRWILFTSRRGDGNYTRLYMAYFDRQGRVRRPVLLPQIDPRHDSRMLRSYNVPEFMVQPVRADIMTLTRCIEKDAVKSRFDGESVRK